MMAVDWIEYLGVDQRADSLRILPQTRPKEDRMKCLFVLFDHLKHRTRKRRCSEADFHFGFNQWLRFAHGVSLCLR